jgi:hypothetical protein
MSQPLANLDPAEEVINAFITALKQAFNPHDVVQPPEGGGSETVRFVAGDVVPLELWDAHAQGGSDCAAPFLWVRLMRRSRARDMTIERTLPNACGQLRVIDIEIGVGRCAALGETVDWAAIAKEAEISRDDSWRIDLALCMAGDALRTAGHQIAVGTVVPYGPEGGVIAWSGDAKISL